MQGKRNGTKFKRVLCAALAVLSVVWMPLPSSAVRVQPVAQEGVVTRWYGISGQEKKLYQAVSKAVIAGESTLDVTLDTPIKDKKTFLEFCRQAVHQVRKDYPESFLDNHTDFLYYYDERGYYRVVYTFGYLSLGKQEKTAMLDEVDRIVSQGQKKTTNDVALLRYFQETLRKRVDYDTVAAKSDSDHYPNSFHAYGALMEGKAVCQGYAYAFKLLCDKAQIPCWIVTGYYGEPHAWNYVWLDGNYYQVDVTRDDTYDRASTSPYFLAGQEYAKDYILEKNAAPGVLAEKSYTESHRTKRVIKRKDSGGLKTEQGRRSE